MSMHSVAGNGSQLGQGWHLEPRHSRLRRAGAGLGLLLGGLGLACHPRVGSAPPTIPVMPTVQEVEEALAARVPLQSLQGSFKLKLTRNGRTDRLNGALVVVSSALLPGALRLELFSPLGPPVGYGVLQPEELSLYLPYSENAFFTSATPEETLRSLTGSPVPIPMLSRTLLGAAPPCLMLAPFEWAADAGRWRIPCAAPGPELPPYALLLEPGTLRLAGVVGTVPESASTSAAAPAAQRVMVLRLDAPVTLAGHVLPTRVDVELGSHTRLELSFDPADLVLDPELTPELFHLDAPDGASILPFEAMMQPVAQERSP